MIARSLFFVLGDRPDRLDKAVALRSGPHPCSGRIVHRGRMVGALELGEQCGRTLCHKDFVPYRIIPNFGEMDPYSRERRDTERLGGEHEGQVSSVRQVAIAAGGLSPCKLRRKTPPKGRSFCGGDPRLASLCQSRADSPDSNPHRELGETVGLPAGSGRLLSRPWPTRSAADFGWLAGLPSVGILLTPGFVTEIGSEQGEGT